MAETITIPSPSVFLRASPEPPLPPPKTQGAISERKKSTVKKKKITPAATKAGESASISKPKQSKSRNGMQRAKLAVTDIEILCGSFRHTEPEILQVASPARPSA